MDIRYTWIHFAFFLIALYLHLAAALFSPRPVASPVSRQRRDSAVPVYVLAYDPIDHCWGDGPVNFVLNLHIGVGVDAAIPDGQSLANLQVAFVGATNVVFSQTWNNANSTTSGNVWSFQTQPGQPNPGGIFAVTGGVQCRDGTTISPPSFQVTGSLVSGGASVTALVQDPGSLSSVPPSDLSSVVFVNGHAPAMNKDGGLAQLSVAFFGAATVTPLQTWSVSASSTKNNVWSFTTVDGVSYLGGFFTATGVSCDSNGVLFPPITTKMSGQLSSGGPIQAGFLVPATDSFQMIIPTASGLPAGNPTPVSSSTGKTIALAVIVPTFVEGAPIYNFTYIIDRCWGSGDVFFPFRLTLKINGHQPMSNVDGGLASISITFDGLPVVKTSSLWVVGNSITTGSTWRFETANNGPNPGGILSTTAPITCNDGVLSIAPSLTFSGQLLSGGPININAVPA
ncbi:hypothetical protein HDU93_003986 [Gonapodya sp. JEL0774]|nr:hypothetical protein HDU93_003986 [Gonapodya sp. JEL0774]